MLGRIKLLEDAREAGRVLSLPAVMKIDNRRILEVDSYSWCWAAAKFLDSHPRYGERFRRLRRNVTNPNFDNLFLAAYRDDWGELQAEWVAFIAALDHGYDFERMAIDFERGTALGAGESSRSATIVADRGWQSTGVWLEAGRTYRVTATGRFQIAEKEFGGAREVWPCEAGGVTIEYHAGQPLGMLLGAVVDSGRVGRESREMAITRGALAEPVAHNQRTPAERAGERVASGFARPLAIGLGRTFTSATSGTLYLRVNDSGGRLGDNRGSLRVSIESAD